MFKVWSARIEQLKPSTRAGYLHRWKSHVQPRWGAVKLVDVEHGDIVNWTAQLRAAGQSPSSISACHGVLSQICQLAILDGRLNRNPCLGVKLPKNSQAAHQDHRIITPTELRQLVAALDDAGPTQHGLMVLTLGYVGLRFGELAGLTVGDVDLEAHTLRVRQNVTEVDGHLYIGSPKSGKPRTVSFPPVALGQRLRVHIGDRPDEDFLFPQGGTDARESAPIRRTNWAKRVFTPAVTDAGLKPLTVHDLRHCYASMAIKAGANVLVVQRQLGHARASITLDIYADLFGDDLSDAAVRLDAIAEALDQTVL